MRYFVLLLFIFNSAVAQNYQQFDTVVNHKHALDLLQNAVLKNKANPVLLYKIADRHFQLYQYDSSIFYSNNVIALLNTTTNNQLLAKAYHLKGVSQYALDDKKKSESNLRTALQLATKEKLYETVIKASSILGAIYLDQGFIDKNLANYHLADSFLTIAYSTLVNTDSLLTNQGLKTLRLKATSLHFQKKYDSAEVLYKEVIKQSFGKYTIPFAGATSFYAAMLGETGRYKEAIAFCKEAARAAVEKQADTKTKTHIMHVYGKLLFDSGNYKEAYQLIDSSYYSLAETYEKVNAQAYAESESKFKNQLLQYQIQIERQNKNRLYILFVILLLVAALIVLWLINRSNKRIALEKAQQKQIAIDAFIEGEEKEKVRIGRELHDGIAQEVVAVKLAMQQQHANPALIAELKRIGDDIRTISHELMPQTLKDYGLKIAIEDICQKILGPSSIRYEIVAVLPEHRLPDKIEITLYRVFQELVHNIIKHSEASEVLVQLRKMNNHILLVVEDNGKGMMNKKNHGIGISNLKSRVQLLDGNLEYDSSEEEGTTAIVRVPY